MKILGIETSCDETAAAVVADGTRLLSNVVASQMDIHAEFGGVVPEVAARSHIEVMLPVIEKALHEAFFPTLPLRAKHEHGRQSVMLEQSEASQKNKILRDTQDDNIDDYWNQIDAIAVTKGPGLIGSLLIGTLTASTIARLKNKPLIPINHVEAHVYANFLVEPEPQFPLLALIVSGGHTQLVLFEDHGKYRLLGQTLDDAAGEAFDKVAKITGLPYPGGPSVAKAAESGDPRAYKLPHPKLSIPNSQFSFSFSGLKTAVLREAQKAVGKDHRLPSFELPRLLSQKQKNDIAASFQETVVDILVSRVLAAFEQYEPKSVVIAGGVAANQALRQELKKRLPIDITYAPMNLCTDNAAMIASAAYFHKKDANASRLVLPDPILSM